MIPREPTEAMIEAVAQALYERNPRYDQEVDLDGRPTTAPYRIKWDKLIEYGVGHYEDILEDARAAIAAYELAAPVAPPPASLEGRAREIIETLIDAVRQDEHATHFGTAGQRQRARGDLDAALKDIQRALAPQASVAEEVRTYEDGLREAAEIAEKWAEQNRAARDRARKSGRSRHAFDGDETQLVMAEQLDGAAIECNAIKHEILARLPASGGSLDKEEG